MPIKRQGEDVTIITYSRMVLIVLDAAEELAKEGINAAVVDARTLSPLDIETIAGSVKKPAGQSSVRRIAKPAAWVRRFSGSTASGPPTWRRVSSPQTA
jgi:pyruvate dehydrogenase E1 component beta subunit